jgi:hypothetical protein
MDVNLVKRLQKPTYSPNRLKGDNEELLRDFVSGATNGNRAEDTNSDAAERLSPADRREFEYIIAEFKLTEGMRRFAKHVTPHGRMAGALDYAEERGSSDAVKDAIMEWGRNEARREKDTG